MPAANPRRRVRGYGLGTVDTVLSVDAVERAAADLAATGPVSSPATAPWRSCTASTCGSVPASRSA
jgi:hypothetical protein